MPVPILSDGTPLTFEWFNAVANAINTLEINSELNTNITVNQQGNAEDDVSIITGKQEFTIKSPARKRGYKIFNDIRFPKSFRDADVTVVAMVTGNTKSKKPVAAGIAVSSISATGFNAVVQMFDDDDEFAEESLEIRYIAVGKRVLV